MKKKIKVVHVFSEVSTGPFVEVLASAMDASKYEVVFIFLEPEEHEFHRELTAKGITYYRTNFRGRRDLPQAIWQLCRLFKKLDLDIVHTHLVNGSLAGLVAAKLCGIKKRVSYRHHSNESYVYFPHAVYYDRIVNRLSKRIAANTKMTADFMIETERVSPDKVDVINLAFDLSTFERSDADGDRAAERHNFKDCYPVIGVVSRFVHWKGIQYTIPAFARLLADFPDAKLVMASAFGSYSTELSALLKESLPLDSYRTINFESDILSLYKTFDVFVHVPIGEHFEAFGQVCVEALAMKVPSVFTLSGVASEFVENERNAMVVPFCDSDSIYEAMKRILLEPELRNGLIVQGAADVTERFGHERIGIELDKFYSRLV
ncbi:MAG: glycosyltransferase family 4 protein [Pyrinomonadaceae bacterium]